MSELSAPQRASSPYLTGDPNELTEITGDPNELTKISFHTSKEEYATKQHQSSSVLTHFWRNGGNVNDQTTMTDKNGNKLHFIFETTQSNGTTALATVNDLKHFQLNKKERCLVAVVKLFLGEAKATKLENDIKKIQLNDDAICRARSRTFFRRLSV